MRVTLVLIAGALALPAFAGNPSLEITPPGAAEEVLQPILRTDVSVDAAPELAEQTDEDLASKEHNDQVDDPDFPPCDGDG